MKKIITGILFCISTFLGLSQNQKFQVNGAARGYMFANELDISTDIDTSTIRKSNYGHTLLDLGFSIFPNDKTEVIAMFRIRNELGGFWGGGVNFNVRQLSLKGVAGNVVRYEIGDLDLKMTPYTLFNNIEEGVVNEADAFALRREIVHYDMFYLGDNSWRMQGGKAQFGLNFDKYIENMAFKTFITRQRATDGLAAPERLYGGATVLITQSKKLQIGINNINLFDLTQTISDSIRFNNTVNTINWKYTTDVNDKLAVGIKGESGFSYVEYLNYNDLSAPEKYDDTFLDVALTSEFKNINTTINLGFKDVGPDFLSAGAQTKRIDYGRFPGLFQQITDNVIGRPVNYFDVINFSSENSYKISEVLMTYNAAYSNTNPYGVATPNRRGVYLNATKTDTTKFKESFVEVAMLSEIRGSGTNKTKNFLVARAGTDVYVNDFLGWKKWIKFDVGLQIESTQRGGEVYEKVNLNSSFIEAGLTLEFLENFDLLFGLKMWSVKGNEYQTIRNKYNTVTDFLPVDYNLSENTSAVGLRYRFSDETNLSAQYQKFDLVDKTTNGINYGIGQFNILYNMFF